MGLFNNIQTWAAKRLVSVGNLSILPSWVRHSFLDTSWEWLVGTAYKQNSTIYACMQILAMNFPEPEIWAYGEDDTHIQGHKLRQLLKRPNPDMGEAELMQFVITYAALSGNIYLWKQRNKQGDVIALWPFHDGHMSPIPGLTTEHGLIAYYVLDVGAYTEVNPFGVTRHDTVVGIPIPKADVIHWKWAIDPEQPYRGMGAVQAAVSDVQIAYEVKNYIYSLLKNDAKPPIVINLVEGDEFDPERVNRLGAQWVAKYGGNNRGRPAFLEHGMNVKELGFSLDQLKIDKLQNSPDASICMCFRIHPAVVGAMIGLENSTYSNYEEASKALTLQTLVPLWRSFASEVYQNLGQERGYEATLYRHALNQVRSLQEDKEKEREFYLSAFNGGAVTRAEFKERVGLTVDSGDNVYKLPLAVQMLPAGGTAVVTLPEKGLGKYRAIEDLNGKVYFTNSTNIDDVGLPAPDMVAMKVLQSKNFGEGDETAVIRKAPTSIYKAQSEAINRLRDIRTGLEPNMAKELRDYFTAVADRGMEKFNNTYKAKKALPDYRLLTELFFGQREFIDLQRIIEKYYIAVAGQSHIVVNAILDLTGEFDITDPSISELLLNAGNQVVEITDTTKEALRETLIYGNNNNWTIDDLARGKDGVSGIRDIVEMTYQNRDRAIARTELGTAQQISTVRRYEDGGGDGVIVFDNGFDNSHENCKLLDGTIQSFQWAKENPLEHPNCVRAFGVWFDDMPDEDQ